MPFSSLVAWSQSASCLPYCFDNQAPGPPSSPSIAYTTSCVSERKTTAILADTFRALAVQNFDGVAVEDGDDGAGVICRQSGAGQKEVKDYGDDDTHSWS